jgi:hypothetical protein
MNCSVQTIDKPAAGRFRAVAVTPMRGNLEDYSKQLDKTTGLLLDTRTS